MRPQPFAQLRHPGGAGLAVVGGGLHLDELVRVEGAADLEPVATGYREAETRRVFRERKGAPLVVRKGL